ncbi:MAG: serine/threonine-protein kinase [Nannocystaceae bacterium]
MVAAGEDTESVSTTGGAGGLALAVAAASPRVDLDAGRAGLEARALDRPAPIPGRIGRFQVIGELGRGGMGVVLAAYDEALDRRVAIKLIRWDAAFSGVARARMQREARALARLSHPNVVQVYDTGELDDGRTYLAMEHVEGRDLARWRAEAPRGWQEILAVFLQCGEGLLAAHGVGLVHRDFKPSNAMIDRRGRVRVLDFGLARGSSAGSITDSITDSIIGSSADASADASAGSVAREAAEPPSSDPRAPSEARREPELGVTRSSAVLGTPAYMAPEQHEGRDADARSDQFSLCAALYEALHDRRPFEGADRRAIYEAILAGPPATPRREVPGWLDAAVLRGLAADPGARWPSLDALLDALRPEAAAAPSTSSRVGAARRRWGAAAALGLASVGLVLVAAIGLGRLADGRAVDACAGAAEPLRGVWDPPRRAEVEAAFAALDTAYARQAGPLLGERLERYADAWVSMSREACEARRRGELSGPLLDRRTICLRYRRTELGALVDRLAAIDEADAADEALARDALRAVASLPDIAACADLAALAAVPAEPDDPAVASRVDGLRDELARAMADELSGRYAEAQARARAVVQAAQELGYRPLEAEAQLRLAFALERTADYEAAKSSLVAGYLAAEESDHELIQTEVASLLSFVVGVRLADTDEGELWARRAERLIERLGEGGEAHAQLLANRGALDLQRGQLEEAVADYRRSLTLFAERRGADDPKLVAPRLALGAALGRLGRLDEAQAEFEGALAQVEASFGDLHPSVAALLNNLGTVAFARGEYEASAAYWERALSIYERTIGLDHPEAAASLNNLGSASTLLGDLVAARGLLERALASRRASLGDAHPLVASVIHNLALVDEREGHHAAAREAYGRAAAILEAAHGPAHPSLRSPLIGLGATSVELGEHARALEHLERAEALDGAGTAPADQARGKIALARALWGVGGDRARARASMREALERVDAGRGREDARLRALATEWLAQHGDDEEDPR